MDEGQAASYNGTTGAARYLSCQGRRWRQPAGSSCRSGINGTFDDGDDFLASDPVSPPMTTTNRNPASAASFSSLSSVDVVLVARTPPYRGCVSLTMWFQV